MQDSESSTPRPIRGCRQGALLQDSLRARHQGGWNYLQICTHLHSFRAEAGGPGSPGLSQCPQSGRVGNGERTGAKSNLHSGERLKGKRGSGIPPKACLSLSRNCQASPVFKGPLTPPPALWGHWKALLLAGDCDQAPPQESRAACQGTDNWPLVTRH